MMILLRPPTRGEFKKRAAALKEKLPDWVVSLELQENFEGFPVVDATVIVKDGHQSTANRTELLDFFYDELVGKEGWEMGSLRFDNQRSWREAQLRREADEARI